MASSPTTTLRSPNPVAAFLTGRTVIFVLRVLLGVVFIWSSTDKVLDPARFAIAVRGYEILPVQLTNLFSLALAWTEVISGIMLVFGIYARQAAAAVFLLLVMFVVAITTTIVRGMVIDCGCFSNEGGTQTGYLLIVRNLLLIVASLLVMRFESGFLNLSRCLSRKAAAG
jgi:putative oxidoreductase